MDATTPATKAKRLHSWRNSPPEVKTYRLREAGSGADEGNPDRVVSPEVKAAWDAGEFHAGKGLTEDDYLWIVRLRPETQPALLRKLRDGERLDVGVLKSPTGSRVRRIQKSRAGGRG